MCACRGVQLAYTWIDEIRGGLLTAFEPADLQLLVSLLTPVPQRFSALQATMLRPQPSIAEDLVLAIDIGSVNAAFCLFCRSTQAISYWQLHALLDQHSPRVRDTSEARKHLDSIMQALQPHLAGRTCQVLVEDQVLKGNSDKDLAKKGIYFLIQLQQCVSMYFLCQGCKVQTLDASERYTFMGISSSKPSRHQKKQAVVHKLKNLLTPGTAFATQPHDLSAWGVKSKKDDLADALCMALQASYRNLNNVYERHIATTGPHSEQPPPKRRKPNRHQQQAAPTVAALDGSKEHLQGKLQALLTHLDMQHHALIRAHQDNASKIAAVFSSVQDKRLGSFMELLHAYNKLGTNARDSSQLASRLGRLA